MGENRNLFKVRGYVKAPDPSGEFFYRSLNEFLLCTEPEITMNVSTAHL